MIKDDGSLSFLSIEPDKSSRQFNCPEITQQKLINLQFFVVDYLDEIKTKYGNDRFLVKIKFNLEDSESDLEYKLFNNTRYENKFRQ